MMAEISVIMPTYNCEKFIGTAVESVLCQTFSDIELIIVDDCSIDETPRILSELQNGDKRIKVLKNERNMGVAETRNRGISFASGRVIALIDSDDIWEPEKLGAQYELYCAGNKIIYCSYGFIDDKGSQIKRPFIVPETTNYRKMLTNNVISCSTILADASLMKNNPFSDSFYHEDYVLWMKLLKIEKNAVGLRDVMAHYRLHDNSRSSKKTRAALNRWKVYREGLGMNFFASAVAFAGYAANGVFKYYLR